VKSFFNYLYLPSVYAVKAARKARIVVAKTFIVDTYSNLLLNVMIKNQNPDLYILKFLKNYANMLLAW